MEREVTQSQLQRGDVDAAMIDLERMTDAVWDEMKGRIDRKVIRQTLDQVLLHYQGARIWGFVPILMQRDVKEILSGGILPSALAAPA